MHDHISWPPAKLTYFATGSLEACADQDPNFFESLTTSALLLGRLSRMTVGIAGLILPLRDPRVLGKQLFTIDVLAGSRLVVAFGIGAIHGDFEVMGVPWEWRGRLTSDHLRALRAMAGEQPVDFESASVSFADGTFLLGAPSDWAVGHGHQRRRTAARGGAGRRLDDGVSLGRRIHRGRGSPSRPGQRRRPRSLDMLHLGYETYVTVAGTH